MVLVVFGSGLGPVLADGESGERGIPAASAQDGRGEKAGRPEPYKRARAAAPGVRESLLQVLIALVLVVSCMGRERPTSAKQ